MTATEEKFASGNGFSKPGLLCVVWVGLSLSIGWGIRGNFGHEYGAMIPGVLATLAAVLLSGRSDWHRRGVFGDSFVGHSGKHIRFDPNTTATKEKPKPGVTHP